jgi:hypothetical protein
VVKFIAIHNSEGQILTLLAQPSDAPVWSRELEAGQQISEVEVPSTELELSDDRFVGYLKDLSANYTVKLQAGAKGRLVSKKGARH